MLGIHQLQLQSMNIVNYFLVHGKLYNYHSIIDVCAKHSKDLSDS